MSAKLEAFQVLARVMIDEGGKRLLGLAADVMTASGRDSLDPIHVVIAATSDEHASPRARAVLDALGINQAVARRFEGKSAKLEGFNGGTVAEAFTAEATEMLQRLNAEYLNFLESSARDSHTDTNKWDWYSRLVGQALNSNSPAVVALRGHVFSN